MTPIEEFKERQKLKRSITVQDVCNLLNEMLACDYGATHDLLCFHTRCNNELLTHPTIQVIHAGADIPTVGILGVLNGLFGVNDDNRGPISCVWENDYIIRFEPTKTE